MLNAAAVLNGGSHAIAAPVENICKRLHLIALETLGNGKFCVDSGSVIGVAKADL